MVVAGTISNAGYDGYSSSRFAIGVGAVLIVQHPERFGKSRRRLVNKVVARVAAMGCKASKIVRLQYRHRRNRWGAELALSIFGRGDRRVERFNQKANARATQASQQQSQQ